MGGLPELFKLSAEEFLRVEEMSNKLLTKGL
jgi:hypothetical protein